MRRSGLLSYTAAMLLFVSCGSEPDAGHLFDGPVEDMEFAWIPSGSFQMGSPESEQDRLSDEGPVHAVTVRGFELMTTEVTQGMWQEVMGADPASGYGEGARMPVYSVSWTDCQEFISRLNDIDAGHLYRLPTEAEWEYACRAGTCTPYFWGTEASGDYCWTRANSRQTVQPIANRLRNPWGLFDMAGNVAEWCEDWYHPEYSGAPSDGSAWLSPEGTQRVMRGGSWADPPEYARSAGRTGFSPDLRFSNIGFRVARNRR